jgi:hypothetical protein
MATRRKRFGNNRTRVKRQNKSKSSKKWITAIEAAQKSLEKTGSVSKANKALKEQALLNARKIFGSVGKTGGA